MVFGALLERPGADPSPSCQLLTKLERVSVQTVSLSVTVAGAAIQHRVLQSLVGKRACSARTCADTLPRQQQEFAGFSVSVEAVNTAPVICGHAGQRVFGTLCATWWLERANLGLSLCRVPAAGAGGILEALTGSLPIET